MHNDVFDPNCYLATSFSECETQESYWCDWPEFCSMSTTSCESDSDCQLDKECSVSGTSCQENSDCSNGETCDQVDICEPDVNASCSSNPINNIIDCLLVTRKITTTSLGAGASYKLISESYYKPGFKLVKQDLKIYWENMPFVSASPFGISTIEYKDPAVPLQVTSNNHFLRKNTIESNDFQSIHDFDFAPLKIMPTLGLQRIEVSND